MTSILQRSSRNKSYGLMINGLVLASLIGCGSPQISDASEKPISSKKSSAPVKAKTRTEIGGKISPRNIAQKMNKQEQELFARQDLAKRLDVKVEETVLSGAIQVTWRSGALGCPQPGMSYTDVLVPGVLIMVKVGNKPYRYHASPGGEPFYCPDSLAESQYLNSSDI